MRHCLTNPFSLKRPSASAHWGFSRLEVTQLQPPYLLLLWNSQMHRLRAHDCLLPQATECQPSGWKRTTDGPRREARL